MRYPGFHHSIASNFRPAIDPENPHGGQFTAVVLTSNTGNDQEESGRNSRANALDNQKKFAEYNSRHYRNVPAEVWNEISTDYRYQQRNRSGDCTGIRARRLHRTRHDAQPFAVLSYRKRRQNRISPFTSQPWMSTRTNRCATRLRRSRQAWPHRRARKQRRHGGLWSVEEFPFAQFRAVMETNYFGALRCIQASCGKCGSGEAGASST